jgi:hypothetical protein
MNAIFFYVSRYWRKIRSFFSRTSAVPDKLAVPDAVPVLTEEQIIKIIESRLQKLYVGVGKMFNEQNDMLHDVITKLIESRPPQPTFKPQTHVVGFQPSATNQKEKKDKKQKRGVEA